MPNSRHCWRNGNSSTAHEVADFVAMVKQTAGYTTSLVPVGKGEFIVFKEP